VQCAQRRLSPHAVPSGQARSRPGVFAEITMKARRSTALVGQPGARLAATLGRDRLLADVRALILRARESVAQRVNATLTMLHWQIGNRIRKDILNEKRAEYGERIVPSLMTQLGWTHFLHIISLNDPLKRDFYAEMCRIERWSTRTLEKNIGSMLFERTALSRKPAKLAELELKPLREEDKLTPDLVFRDPYFLDFLGLKGA